MSQLEPIVISGMMEGLEGSPIPCLVHFHHCLCAQVSPLLNSLATRQPASEQNTHPYIKLIIFNVPAAICCHP